MWIPPLLSRHFYSVYQIDIFGTKRLDVASRCRADPVCSIAVLPAIEMFELFRILWFISFKAILFARWNSFSEQTLQHTINPLHCMPVNTAYHSVWQNPIIVSAFLALLSRGLVGVAALPSIVAAFAMKVSIFALVRHPKYWEERMNCIWFA